MLVLNLIYINNTSNMYACEYMKQISGNNIVFYIYLDLILPHSVSRLDETSHVSIKYSNLFIIFLKITTEKKQLNDSVVQIFFWRKFSNIFSVRKTGSRATSFRKIIFLAKKIKIK